MLFLCLLAQEANSCAVGCVAVAEPQSAAGRSASRERRICPSRVLVLERSSAPCRERVIAHPPGVLSKVSGLGPARRVPCLTLVVQGPAQRFRADAQRAVARARPAHFLSLPAARSRRPRTPPGLLEDWQPASREPSQGSRAPSKQAGPLAQAALRDTAKHMAKR